MPDLPGLHKPEAIVKFFRDVVLQNHEVFVAKAEDSIVGFCAGSIGLLVSGRFR
jgi:hypothetical protein